jgi:sortase A
MRLALRRRRVIVLIVTAMALLAGGGTLIAGRAGGVDPKPRAEFVDQPLLDVRIPPPLLGLAPSTTLVPLPVPEPAPTDPYAPEPEVLLGTIEIPRIGLVHPIYQGVSLTTIDRGPGHWPGTAMPGHLGNAVFAGHRVTHTHPFLQIDQLRMDDPVIFTVYGKRYVYEVTGNQVVTPEEVHIVEQTRAYTATLFGCHPPHSARFRFVVHLKLVEPKPAG